ncbi:hypothetical protein A9Q84_04105 [Halobacteriovorax marinus]|uniref:Uncharacterized protein n=1 Tax=Halobacteriovorax marinus TaxID=97084 RepID=A0A1Y5FAG9_9BACT|nr:hypothetical protein A9Q84_04105 [Halobacteriovorax marinus]
MLKCCKGFLTKPNLEGKQNMSKNRIKVIEAQSGEVLFECDFEDHDKAFDYAHRMEDMGIEIKIHAPSLTETLAESLGANEEELSAMRGEIDDEIASHIHTDELGCVVCMPEDPNLPKQ